MDVEIALIKIAIVKIEHFTNNIIANFETQLNEELYSCSYFSIATAFINTKAIDILEEVLRKNKTIITGKLIVGLYHFFNKKTDLLRLLDLERTLKGRLIVRIANTDFHWKYYYFEEHNKKTVFTGSANFTSFGLLKNNELVFKFHGSDKKNTTIS